MENSRRDFFMTKSPWKNVPDVGIELGAAWMPSRHTSAWHASGPSSILTSGTFLAGRERSALILLTTVKPLVKRELKKIKVKSQLISLHAAVGVLAVIAAVSVSINFYLWRRQSAITKAVADIRPPEVDPGINGSNANGYDDLNPVISDTHDYLTITHEY